MGLFVESLCECVLNIPEDYVCEVVYFGLDFLFEKGDDQFELFKLQPNCIQMSAYSLL